MATFGRVTGQFSTFVDDSLDADELPDRQYLKGTITFTPKVAKQIDKSSTPGMILGGTPFTGTLDSLGRLCNTKSMLPGLGVVANDDTNLNPAVTAYTVNYSLTDQDGRPISFDSHDIFVPGGTSVDLSDFIPPSGAPSIGTAQAEAASGRAAASAALAAQAATAANASLALAVRTINGTAPDSAGNVVVAGGGTGGAGTDQTARDAASTAQARADAAYTLAGGKYTLADNTIALARLATAVQTSIGKADTAVQPATLTSTLANYAPLVGGVLPTSVLPSLAINDIFPVASQAAMLALTAQRGDMAVRSDTGQTFVLSTDVASSLANWILLPMPTVPVQSVNGFTGAVVLGKSDVGLSVVDNTSDANKPLSTAATTALAGKAATSHTHTASQITDATTIGKSVLTAADATTIRNTIGAGTSNLVVGTTAGTAKDGAYQPLSSNISDASAVGKSVLTAVDAATARGAIGAMSASLMAAGTTSVPAGSPVGIYAVRAA